ncbi:hypothetical protein PAAG_12353 [Paracoccidioides lutzii Pb01]|uniref:Uncharacterized protein n=1 Tax=Paracoccidioides lutzii (strain ATCC MYA-826 / Pb01) TaxID=502779 RepID=A0A0A2V492_PARBA|nr:hypothetical protein PAAG_12353 [Paracoccidioides lutzii Pb01]KGQ00980.1 hypothetical protein PAAG_12353 [Paracoccidioides lutzii Pb01]
MCSPSQHASAQNQRPVPQQRQSKPNNTNTKKLWENHPARTRPILERTEKPEIALRHLARPLREVSGNSSMTDRSG